ncbi:MAG: 4Fe-4S binding protein [Patescibacteria group bacterium]
MQRQRVRKAMILVSFLLFPVVLNYLSPALIIMGASEGLVSGSFLFFALLFAGSLFLGRAFCGWVCPAAGLQEACFAARDRRVKGGDWIKYLIWVPWLATIALAAMGAGGFKRIAPLYLTEKGISVVDPQNYVIYYFVLALVATLALAVGKRSFCHHVCWMAPFMIAGRKLRNLLGWPALGLRAQQDNCKKCALCTRECPMSLDVQGMVAAGRMERAECILCGSCVDACKNGAICYTWRAGRGTAPGAPGRRIAG